MRNRVLAVPLVLERWLHLDLHPAKHSRVAWNNSLKAFVLTSRGTMNLTLRCLRVIFQVLTLSNALAAAQGDEIVCRQQFKTPNNCYRLNKSPDPARGLVVLLPYYGSDANEFSSAALPALLAKKNVATMAVSASGYLMDDDLATLRALIEEVVRELNIPAGSLVVGGISAGGTGAVRYSEYCISGHCDARSRPVAIFSVDAPLDFESWWNREKLNLRRGNPKSGQEESQSDRERGRVWQRQRLRVCTKTLLMANGWTRAEGRPTRTVILRIRRSS